jgi:hypothetical protein
VDIGAPKLPPIGRGDERGTERARRRRSRRDDRVGAAYIKARGRVAKIQALDRRTGPSPRLSETPPKTKSELR